MLGRNTWETYVWMENNIKFHFMEMGLRLQNEFIWLSIGSIDMNINKAMNLHISQKVGNF
jgi:hypothetical protein